MNILEQFHIVRNGHVFNDKFEKIADSLKVPIGVARGIHSDIMSFGGMNCGKINRQMFVYILCQFEIEQDRFDSFIASYTKHKVIDGRFNIVNWNSYKVLNV